MSEIFKEALGSIMDSLLDIADKEREQSESYKDLFGKVEGGSIEGLLREVEHKMTSIALDAHAVIEKRFGIKLSTEQFNVLCSLSYVENELTSHITKTEGYSCSVDKAYYLLNKYFLSQPERSDESEEQGDE